MNWRSVIEGLLLIGSWMTISMLAAILCIWIIHRYFPRNPDAEYTYVLKSTNGNRTTVVLPPGLPETERRKVLDEAYRRLGVQPERGP
ncbi:hypothetical protein ACEN9F_10250 [Duganella sp. CT11-25]|uniref:hypothetical protein n=1 Tax=unclassified Duganella TaxID=2636909 RepID=UPI0039B07F86